MLRQYDDYECDDFDFLPYDKVDELRSNLKDLIEHVHSPYALDAEHIALYIEKMGDILGVISPKKIPNIFNTKSPEYVEAHLRRFENMDLLYKVFYTPQELSKRLCRWGVAEYYQLSFDEIVDFCESDYVLEKMRLACATGNV